MSTTPVPPGPAAPGESPTIDQAPGAAAAAPSVWQNPFVQNVLPFATSVLLHAGLIVLGLATVQVVRHIVTTASREQIIIPDMGPMVQSPGGSLNPGGFGDPFRPELQDKFPEVSPDSQGHASMPSREMAQALAGDGGGAGDAVSDSVLIGAGQSAGRPGRGANGIGGGVGERIGAGGAGTLAPFGVPGGGDGTYGPRVSFIGDHGANAYRVAFVCDASGSMLQKFDALRVELRKAIEGLRPPQSFNALFFQAESASAVDKELLVATPENKRKAVEFLDKTSPHSATDPLPALRQAFAMKPQLIFLLTDGDFPDNAAVEAEIRKLNAGKGCKINTIAFMDRGADYEKVLKSIAAENGGTFRYVSGEDLGK